MDLVHGLTSRGHEVHVAVRPNSPLIDELRQAVGVQQASLKFTTLPLRNSLDVSSARSLAGLVRREKIQIVHAHMARDYPLASYAVRGNKHSRLIVTRHVLFSLNKLHRITLSKAARIIAVSNAVATQLRIDAIAVDDRITVVLNGIDVKRFENARAGFDRDGFLAGRGLAANTLLIGTVGELTPLKGQRRVFKSGSGSAKTVS